MLLSLLLLMGKVAAAMDNGADIDQDNGRCVTGMAVVAGEPGDGGGDNIVGGGCGDTSLRGFTAVGPRQGHRLGPKGVHAGR